MDNLIQSLPINKVPITVDDSNEFWKHMKEKVSSSRSTHHIGTYKAAALYMIPIQKYKLL